MKKLLMKLEINKVNKLVNNEETVVFTTGKEINYIYNRKTRKRYYPKYSMLITE